MKFPRTPLPRYRTRLRGTVGHVPNGRRIGLYAIGLGTWVTGAGWLIFRYFISGTDEFGFSSVSPVQHWLLVGHAIVSFFAIWMFGVMWPIHIKIGWAAKIRRITGGTIFAAAALLCATGPSLYYVRNDVLRSWTSILHWSVGLAAFGAFLVHLGTLSPSTRGKKP